MRSNSARRWVWLAGVLLCAGGAYVSWALSQRHVASGVGEDSLLGRMCADGTANCDQVIKSPLGTVYGQPTAVWGMIYFTAAGLWLVLNGLPNRRGRWWHVPAILAALAGLAIAARLDYEMFFRLPTWCPLCLITHIVSLLLLVAVVLMWPRPARKAAEEAVPVPADGVPASVRVSDEPASPRPGRVLMTCIAIAIAAVAVGQDFWRRVHRAEERQARTELAAARAELARLTTVTHVGAIPIRPDDPMTGDPQAPNTIVVFSDFECPLCAGFAGFWKKEIAPYAQGKVRLVYKHFPMNTACNPNVSKTLHERSCESAEVGEAARRLGGSAAFWSMHDELLMNQFRRADRKLSLADLAARVGLDAARLEEERKDPKVRERIQEDIETARKLGVSGTPAIFLNGRLAHTSGPDPVWQQFLASLKPPTSAPATRAATQPAGR